MKSILLILFNTRRGLELLDNEFEDDLKRKSVLIFGFYAMVQFLFFFDKERVSNGFVFNFLELVIAVVLFISIMTICALILHKIGEWLGGKANYIEVFSIFVYAYIPISLEY